MTALPLRINAQLLREKRACKEGIQIFLNRFGESGELVWYGDERDKKTVRREWALRPYYFWFLTTFNLTNVSGNLSNVRGDLSYVSGRLTEKRAKVLGVHK